MQRRNRILLAVGIALVLAVPLAWWASRVWKLWIFSKPTTTIGCMPNVTSILLAERPRDFDPESLAPLFAKYDREDCVRDGWGRPFVIEVSGIRGSDTAFRVISLGRDGKRGPCCKAFVDDWDDDAVLEGDVWVQRWSFGRTVPQ
jgi:hypothetical protein